VEVAHSLPEAVNHQGSTMSEFKHCATRVTEMTPFFFTPSQERELDHE
jgi:hypothetical protein